MPMLMALFLFCNRSLHALELPYGPVSLTLLDIVAIIGLKPLGKTYALGLFKDQIERAEIDIDFSDKSCGDFIEKNVRNTKQISNSTTSKPLKIDISKGLDDFDKDVPVSSSFKATSAATPKQKVDKIVDLSSSQDPSQSDDNGATSIPEPIIEKNAIEVDSTLDDLLNIETEHNPLTVEEQVRIEAVIDTSAPMLVVETSEPILEQCNNKDPLFSSTCFD
ncbi:hypothetical protein JHK85_033940 [Glycine max]|nr:hypothetical protein JHK85_033940 [Glycine max]